MHEEWRPVRGWEDCYEVSNLGKIRSLKHRGKPRKIPWVMSPSMCNRGYMRVNLQVGERKQPTGLHRLILQSFVGDCPEGHEACHNDGDPTNNRLDNLRWGTKRENMRDRDNHGTTMRGASQHLSIFTDDDVRRIRKMDDAGMMRTRIVEMICEEKRCYPKTVWNIIYRKTWKHVV